MRKMFAVIAIVLASSANSWAQFEKVISTTFDGWKQLPDGRFELVFGYMNRNASEVEVPLGAANRIDPAPADQGQPTNFLPGRQREAFHIVVPKDFKGKFVWTLTYAGTTQTATGSLDQNYSLDVGDPEPPGIKAGPDATTTMKEAVKLVPIVTAPPPEKAPENPNVVARRASGARINVWWSKFRGPGTVTFSEGERVAAAPPDPTGRAFALGALRITCANPPPADCGATTARFSAPGTYWIRVVAAERSAANALMKVVVTP